jgi:AcrR family transcriptional regulator
LPGLAEARSLRKDAARNRERLLAAANEVFAEKGLHACLSEVADRAGVGMGTIYRRFPDKQALVAALLEEKYGAMTAVARRAAGKPDGWEAFSALMSGMTELLAHDQALAELMLSNGSHDAVNARKAEYRAIVAGILARAKQDGTLRPDISATDISPLLNMATAAADYTAPLGRQVWPRFLQLLLEGLKTGPHNTALAVDALSEEERSSASRSSWRRRAAVRRTTAVTTAVTEAQAPADNSENDTAPRRHK